MIINSCSWSLRATGAADGADGVPHNQRPPIKQDGSPLASQNGSIAGGFASVKVTTALHQSKFGVAKMVKAKTWKRNNLI